MGVIRSTVWVGPDGKIKRHWRNVAKAADRPQKVLEAVQAKISLLNGFRVAENPEDATVLLFAWKHQNPSISRFVI